MVAVLLQKLFKLGVVVHVSLVRLDLQGDIIGFIVAHSLPMDRHKKEGAPLFYFDVFFFLSKGLHGSDGINLLQNVIHDRLHGGLIDILIRDEWGADGQLAKW